MVPVPAALRRHARSPHARPRHDADDDGSNADDDGSNADDDYAHDHAAVGVLRRHPRPRRPHPHRRHPAGALTAVALRAAAAGVAPPIGKGLTR